MIVLNPKNSFLTSTTGHHFFRRDHSRRRPGQSVLSRYRGSLSDGQLHLQPQHIHLPREVGGPELRHHVIRQHRLGHAHRVSMRLHGRLDTHPILGKIERHSRYPGARLRYAQFKHSDWLINIFQPITAVKTSMAC